MISSLFWISETVQRLRKWKQTMIAFNVPLLYPALMAFAENIKTRAHNKLRLWIFPIQALLSVLLKSVSIVVGVFLLFHASFQFRQYWFEKCIVFYHLTNARRNHNRQNERPLDIFSMSNALWKLVSFRRSWSCGYILYSVAQKQTNAIAEATRKLETDYALKGTFDE